MKTLIKNKIIIALVATMTLGACSHFEELNQDPTTSTNMDPNLMLPTIQMQVSGERYETWRNSFIYSSDWMQLWTGEYATVEIGGKGQKNNDYMSAIWDRQYSREIRNVVDMIERTAEDPEAQSINAVARIMKAMIFSRLTDLYGDIPYFDAGKGYFSGVLKPTYDTQEAIYQDLFDQLELAADALDPAADAVTQDFYFEGNIDQWRKFANSLRLRLAMRLVKVDPAMAQQEAEAAIAAGVMESNADIPIMYHNDAPFGGGGQGGNGTSYTLMSSSARESSFRMCRTLAEYLESTGDPRIQLMAGSYLDDGTYAGRTDISDQVFAEIGNYSDLSVLPSNFVWQAAGAPIEVDVDGVATEVSGALQLLQPAREISRIDAPFIVMSYAEVELWMAEAAFRGWAAGGTAAEHFAAALAAGVAQYSEYEIELPDQATIDAFVAANPLTVGTELEQINTQLWVNFAFNPIEAYSNWRRSGFPAITYPNVDPGVNQSNGEIPRRMQYPVNEYLLNEENLSAAAARMSGGDDWTSRIWWDVE
ncbi:SusD/RagB family nutrient-binding outer membrane lipoprotein [Reichenbachiella ulvae]|uniref:SusD/RagB family nutrient-binding outer membrane lipoprotein n=1 Tax=Reichenbachiella ulvae TaxID=2980104 RepID=A0ABT3CYI8_9BACT|nr:SusD/RagB family nutrient-binding outer membrane lipoprotein [Reichenbachiella ulvae]MCV9388765.1 SusD/RagB family nutrient-binding outer membrane lipoprotein [Reichenbachiella ulvae]